jgi:tetratricopeptide (TPR) repeat protein
MRTWLFASVLLIMGIPPAASQTRAQLGDCHVDVAARTRIAACTRLLGSPGISRDLRIVALDYRARAYAELGNHAGAVLDFSQALRLDPNDADLYVRRGMSLLKLGRIAEARADAARAMALLDKDPNPDDGTMVGLTLLINDLNRVTRAGRPPAGEAGRPPPKAPAPPGAPVEFTWQFRNNAGEQLQVRVFAPARGKKWPGDDVSWPLYSVGPYEFKIECQQGEQICYGAWGYYNPDTYWGIGRHGEHRCQACCYVCNEGGRSVVHTLNPG